MHPYSSILGPVDSAFYYVERPETPMNIGSLTIFEGRINFDELVDFLDSRIHQAPLYQQRIVQAPFNLGQPTWVPDPDFYIGNHIKRVRIDPPASLEQLRATTGRLLSKTLDRSKPLWEVYYIDGLENQTALFFKVHHCMVDGLSAVELFSLLMDVTPEFQGIKPKPLYDAPSLPNQVQLTVDSIRRDVGHRFGLLGKIFDETRRLTSVVTDPDKRLKMLLAGAHLINNNLRPIKKLQINGKNTGRQTLVWSEFDLSDIHAIRKQGGGTVNDVMLTILTGALLKYMSARGGTDQPFVRVLIPVSVREEEEKGEYGNRISVLPIDIPLDENISPMERLASVIHFTKVMKESSLSYSMDLILTLPSLLPSVTHQLVWELAPAAFSLLAHTWCTNVAAMPIPVYLMGHELKHIYGYFPLNPSMGLCSVVVSYNGRITLTLVLDTGIIDSIAELEQHVQSSFTELKKAAKVMRPEPVVLPKTENGTHAPETETVAETEVLTVSSNGTNHVSGEVALPSEESSPVAPVEEIQEGEPLVEEPKHDSAPAVKAPERYRLFSDDWAKVLYDILNDSQDYYKASTGWTAGSLAFVLEAAPSHGYETSVAVLLDLHKGKCRSARALPVQDALKKADFVLQGNFSTWISVLNGRTAPLVALTSGKLHLKKGSMLRLMPYTRSASELVKCAQRVPWE